uniref:Energy-converting hydrogenase A subunit K n=1 Tax=Methanococcus maripaludis (strain C6 / ATCC BAA-1332) TaxID=444158 RepID=A9A9K5_METM6
MKQYIQLLSIAGFVVLGMIVLINMLQYPITPILGLFVVLLIGILILLIQNKKITHLIETTEHLMMLAVLIAFIYLGYFAFITG